MKLHLGCGHKLWEGYVNCDAAPPADRICDITDLPEDLTGCEEITAIHVFEHILRVDAEDVLVHWLDRLMPRGKLILEMPCLDVVRTWLGDPDARKRRSAMWALYGEPREAAIRVENLHKWCWSKADIQYASAALNVDTRISSVRFEDARFHMPERDMRVVFTRK